MRIKKGEKRQTVQMGESNANLVISSSCALRMDTPRLIYTLSLGHELLDRQTQCEYSPCPSVGLGSFAKLITALIKGYHLGKAAVTKGLMWYMHEKQKIC